jgi:hypothetical protein
MKKIALVLFLTSTLFLLQAKTVEEIKEEVDKYSHNIGFIASTQRETLKQQFPMCDEFLDVHWFEKKPNTLQRGWRKYTTAFDYKYDADKAEYVKKEEDTTVYELVEIQEDGHAEYYGLYFIKRAFPKTWKQVIQDMTISGNNKQFTFHYKGKKYDASKFKFNMADNYLNICVAKPDNETALFYEMRRASKVLSDEEMKDYFYEIKRDVPSMDYSDSMVIDNIHNAIIYDINNDNILDFLWNREMWIYSVEKKFYKTIPKKEWKENHFKRIYLYPPKNLKCIIEEKQIYNVEHFYTDGYSLYFTEYRQNCNLTQLTTQSQGEN